MQHGQSWIGDIDAQVFSLVRALAADHERGTHAD
ncbi:hypothetical protein RAM_37275 [Amycolatopsis mediterranei S699]|uniref:Uncharacterized protein n=1 Tax=Amycolatopsis mediterranei (strain S699) TaxID=713604 RepID=A0A9R0P489_AMYMS|nr:hypothetical protein RAM_37275 [Amycolatopsis mediterranei S699]